MHNHDSSLVQPWLVNNQIEAWRTRPLHLHYPYVYLDGFDLRQRWAGEMQTVSFLVAVGVSEAGDRETIGVQFGSAEGLGFWVSFLEHLRRRGLRGVRLFVSDEFAGLDHALREQFSTAQWQQCVKHFYQGVTEGVPQARVRIATHMLQEIHAQSSREAAVHKARACTAALRASNLDEAATALQGGLENTLRYYPFPRPHWQRLRTNASLELVLRTVRRRTIVEGSLPDRQLALVLVGSQLRRRFRRTPDLRWRRAKYLDVRSS